MNSTDYLFSLLAFLAAGLVSFAVTPAASKFAYKIGAIDVPKDNRRMHKLPIPRVGGLAIFLGFIVAVIAFGVLDETMESVLVGATVIVILGVFDDVFRLKAWVKLIFQFAAALIPVLWGNLRIETLFNFNLVSEDPYVLLNSFSIPVTIFWIVAVTNAVNFIDGLDGLAAGISSISAITLLIISCIIGDPYVVVVMAALAGATIGFLPFNMNPAKIFMGDTGALFLGYILATMSIQGLFKFYAVVGFAVPLLVLALPIFDIINAVARRTIKGKNPMSPDREHFHHKLIDMGFSQKQAVVILYSASGLLGLIAVVVASSGEGKTIILIAAIVLAFIVSARLLSFYTSKKNGADTSDTSEPSTVSPAAEDSASDGEDSDRKE